MKPLNDTQKEVIQLYVMGFSTKFIAHKMKSSYSYINRMKNALCREFACSSLIQLVYLLTKKEQI